MTHILIAMMVIAIVSGGLWIYRNPSILRKTSDLTPTPTVSSTATPTTTPAENAFCGGIANIKCSAGYECMITADYPDAGGVCVKIGF